MQSITLAYLLAQAENHMIKPTSTYSIKCKIKMEVLAILMKHILLTYLCSQWQSCLSMARYIGLCKSDKHGNCNL